MLFVDVDRYVFKTDKIEDAINPCPVCVRCQEAWHGPRLLDAIRLLLNIFYLFALSDLSLKYLTSNLASYSHFNVNFSAMDGVLNSREVT